MRKRAQLRGSSPLSQTSEPVKTKRKTFAWKKNWWVAVALVGIFFLFLLLNTYFNISSGFAINPNGQNLSEKFYLAGPDPYYNMRLVETTVQTGHYPFYSATDPLLNYPLGATGGRAPLMNMMAIGLSKVFLPVMSESDALGYAMQFLPALLGALIIFPVYFIGKTLFNKKVGLIAALLVALIPIQIGSGHGSSYTLFDHDSFNLLFMFLTFLFLIKGIKEKDTVRSILYALLSGLSLAALSMTWVEAQYIYVIVSIYIIVQMIVDIFLGKIEFRIPRTAIITLFAGYGISLPVLINKIGFGPDIPLYLCIVVALFGGFYIFLGWKKIPWIISIPTIFGLGIVGLVFLYFVPIISSSFSFLSPLTRISSILYGGTGGIYSDKVSQTIAEASTYNISRTWMSYSPILYFLALIAFALLLYSFFKEKWRRDYLFIMVLFILDMWLAGTAGRFLNDFVPVVAILSGWMVWFLIDKIQYKQVLRNIRNAGGGLRGLRKGLKIIPVLGALFVFCLVLLNVVLAFDAAIPQASIKNGTTSMKIEYFGENYSGAFGSGLYKEQYWVDAFAWLNNQDTQITDPAKRPAFISWWDYGFYDAAVSGHPTVADNFQDGIPPAANFHTAKNEKEAVGVMIVRILEGNLIDNKGTYSPGVISSFEKYLGVNETTNITNWIKNVQTSPSLGAPIGEQYSESLSKLYPVGQQWPANAYYHDVVKELNDTLDDEQITRLYHDLITDTGYSIRYYGVEGYDRDIFNIFGFLGDKSIVLPALKLRSTELNNPEDDFVKIYYTGYNINADGTPGSDGQWSAEDYNKLSVDEKRYVRITGTGVEYKDDYFNSMFYKTYIGTPPQTDSTGRKQMPQGQIPCYGMKHFVAEYISPYPYTSGFRAAVIAKYYEGAYINGTLLCNNTPLPSAQVVVFDKYYEESGFPIPHDYTYTDVDGSFHLIAPAGNITLQFSYANQVMLKELTFNKTDDQLFSPITEQEATRTGNYTREINISVDLASVDGFVYEDNNNNDLYEPGIDTPLPGVTVQLDDEFAPYLGRTTSPFVTTTDVNGHYLATNLYPSQYTITATQNGFDINSSSVSVPPGPMSHNMSKPQLAGMEGIVSDPSGNTVNAADVTLRYSKDNKVNGTMITDTQGRYAFSKRVPGGYVLNVTIANSTTGYYDYVFEDTVTLEENKTLFSNVTLDYAAITVKGYTKYGTQNIVNLSISFSPDKSVANNTAKQTSVTSDTTNGFYSASLQPGYYNISVYQTVNESGQDITYTYTGNLVVKKGEGIKTKDLLLQREQ